MEEGEKSRENTQKWQSEELKENVQNVEVLYEEMSRDMSKIKVVNGKLSNEAPLLLLMYKNYQFELNELYDYNKNYAYTFIKYLLQQQFSK